MSNEVLRPPSPIHSSITITSTPLTQRFTPFRLFIRCDPPHPHNSHKFLPFSPGLTLGENKPSLSLSLSLPSSPSLPPSPSLFKLLFPHSQTRRRATRNIAPERPAQWEVGNKVLRGIRSGGGGICAHSRESCTSSPLSQQQRSHVG